MEHSASVEALRHVTQALETLDSLPDTSERAQRELALLTIKAPVLRNTRGQAAPEVEETYARAYTLCQQGEHAPQLFPTLRGLFNVYLNRAELQAAQELGETCLEFAQRQQDSTLLLWGHGVKGMHLYYSGEFTSARVHFEPWLGFYDLQQHRSLAFTYGQDVGVAHLTFLSWILGVAWLSRPSLEEESRGVGPRQRIVDPL